MPINPLQETLTPFVNELKLSAKSGNYKAQQVINLYNMYVRCPEEGARTLCESFFEDWKKERK